MSAQQLAPDPAPASRLQQLPDSQIYGVLINAGPSVPSVVPALGAAAITDESPMCTRENEGEGNYSSTMCRVS